MARPKTNNELIKISALNFSKLNNLVDSYSIVEQNKEFPPGTMNRNMRDVLAHLHHWHLLMLNWHEVGMRGEKPDMPAKGFTWKTTSELNRTIWEKYKNTSLKNVREELNASFLKIQDLIQQHANEDLFEKKRYSWTGSTSLGSYLVSSTSSHYDWAFKLIKKAMKKNTK